MEPVKYLKKLLRDFVYFIYPPTCLLCSRQLKDEEKLVCFECEMDLDAVPFATCPICGGIVLPDAKGCVMGHDEDLEIEFIRSFAKFDGKIKQLIHALKYDKKFTVAHILGKKLAEMINQEKHFEEFYAYIPTPLHRTKKRSRGYNQSIVIADVLSSLTDKPVLKDVIIRKKFTVTQTELNQEERTKNVSGAFEVLKPERIIGKNLIIVDDVCTTGSTMTEIARVCHKAGAARIAAVTLAKTGLDDI